MLSALTYSSVSKLQAKDLQIHRNKKLVLSLGLSHLISGSKSDLPPVVMMICLCLYTTASSKSGCFVKSLTRKACQCRQEERQNKTVLYTQFVSDLLIPNNSFLPISSTFFYGIYSTCLSPCCKMLTNPK